MILVIVCANEAALRLYKKYKFVEGWRRITHTWKRDEFTL